MGTHIDSFFPRTAEQSLEAVRARLDRAFSGLGDDLAAIRDRGRFSQDQGDWFLWNDEEAIEGEGPGGFCIRVYSQLVMLTSVERFGAITHPDQGIHLALRRVIEVVSEELGGHGLLAVAAGGFGDTDEAGDLALSGAGFPEVCDCLQRVIGPPARSWEALQAGLGEWYLGAQRENQSHTFRSS